MADANDPTDPQNHPVGKTLNALERAIEACKDIAVADALNDTEGEALGTITSALLLLWDTFADRQIAESPNVGNVIPENEIEEAEARVYKRLVTKLATSKEPHLQKIALQEMDEDDFSKC